MSSKRARASAVAGSSADPLKTPTKKVKLSSRGKAVPSETTRDPARQLPTPPSTSSGLKIKIRIPPSVSRSSPDSSVASTPSSPTNEAPATAPLPTPPSTASKIRQELQSKPAFTSTSDLPPHLHTLLLLHTAFDLTLSLHLATNPPSISPLAPKSPGSSSSSAPSPPPNKVELKNVATYVGLKQAVENSASRHFKQDSLRRLMWLYQWSEMDDESVASNAEALTSISLTPTRTLQPQTRQPIHTYGITLTLPKHNQTWIPTASPSSMSAHSVVATYSSQSSLREELVRFRLSKWVERCKAEKKDKKASKVSVDGFVDLDEDYDENFIMNLPLGEPLPALPQGAAVVPRDVAISSRQEPIGVDTARRFLFGKSPLNGASSASTSTPNQLPPALADPFTIDGEVKTIPPPLKTGPLTLEQRQQARRDRIKAKESASSSPSSSQVNLGGIASLGPSASFTLSAQQQELQRRSILSRLSGIAEGIFLLFSTPNYSSPLASPGSVSLGNRRRVIPLEEVSAAVVKSKEISDAEALQSIRLLASLCPDFIKINVLGREDHVEMSTTSASTPKVIGSMPGSPGGRNGGGSPILREVRERIRKELGN